MDYDRPTKAFVDSCFTLYDLVISGKCQGMDVTALEQCTHAFASEARALQAEVLALREELTECEAEFRAPLRATIARVEALPAKWREWAARPRSPLFTNAEHALAKFTFEGCADQLEAALRG